MNKKRSVASKRKQRIKQKKRKRFLVHSVLKDSDETKNVTTTVDSEDDSFGSPGTPPPTTSNTFSEAEASCLSPPCVNNRELRSSLDSPQPTPSDESPLYRCSQISCGEKDQVKELREKCKFYKALLAQGRKIIKEQESEIDEVIQEAQRKVDSVRTFWRDKLFREQSRAGKIIKRAVCIKL